MLLSAEHQEELEAILEQAQHPNDLVRACRLVSSGLGFDFYVFGIRIPQMKEDRQIVLSGLPPSWNQVYDDRKYMLVDPLILMSMSRSTPFAWDQVDWQASARVAEMRAESYRHGLDFGMTVPLHGPTSSLGVFNLARPHQPIPVNPADRKLLFARAHMYGTRIYGRLNDIAIEQMQRERATDFAPRERQSLQFLATGLNAKQIAAKMGIKPASVVTHLGNAMDRFGASNLKEILTKAVLTRNVLLETYPDRVDASAVFVEDPNTPPVDPAEKDATTAD